MTNKRIILVVSAVLIAVVAIGALVANVQGQGEAEIGVVNLDAVYTQYMAPPLVAARDELQAEFDEASADLDNDATAALFAEYQAQLDAMEKQYRDDIQDAIDQVGQDRGMDLVIDSAAVLYGAVDLTADVIKALQ